MELTSCFIGRWNNQLLFINVTDVIVTGLRILLTLFIVSCLFGSDVMKPCGCQRGHNGPDVI